MARKKETLGHKLGILEIKRYLARRTDDDALLEEVKKQEAKIITTAGGSINLDQEDSWEYFAYKDSVNTIEAIIPMYQANSQMISNYGERARNDLYRFHSAEAEHNDKLQQPLLVFGKDEAGNYLDADGQPIPTEYAEPTAIEEDEIGQPVYKYDFERNDTVARLKQAGVALVQYDSLEGEYKAAAQGEDWKQTQQTLDRKLSEDNRYLMEAVAGHPSILPAYVNAIYKGLKEMRRWEYAAAVLEGFFKIEGIAEVITPGDLRYDAVITVLHYNNALSFIDEELIQRHGKGSEARITTFFQEAREAWLKPIDFFGEDPHLLFGDKDHIELVANAFPKKAVKTAVKAMIYEDIANIGQFTRFINALIKQEGVL